ncbi:macrolide family glycosyltransferase [Streptomyces sp. WI04-05B]|uniref:macrolide family glycosyltransferase n=1 Tax=Streptomyces TaxID=1883 RepID=UPI0029B4B17A|nr:MULTISPECIES: macrolide family glycosyltransferase [unclassified Streptomyces]MDX2546241.1 glycosyltransferase [Streptomyces sp. WI04-05B]MDX2583264.1 glycosyltransferase [Streptomyces sp. WI04-05A]MDX3745031.1 glycosyltransferase [Streptomyces sp. AK08-02]
MSTIAFLGIGMHGHINPTLPVVAELVRRGHTVTYHTSPAFRAEIEATGATVHLYPGGDQPLPDPPTPVSWMESLASSAVRLLPPVLADLRRDRPALIVHDSACLWGAVAARELGVPAASSFTTFALDRHVPSPTRGSWDLLTTARAQPRRVQGYLRSRWALHRRFDAHGLPLLDLANIRQPLNLVYTSRAFQPAVEGFDESYRFVGPCIGARPPDPSFPADRLRDPVLFASLGTVFNADPQLLRSLATGLAPLGGTVIVSTGQTDPEALGPLPADVFARRFVPQPEVLARAALFVTHGGMNSVNEAMYAGVPLLVVPQGADQPMVARRVVELGAGLSMRTQDVARGSVRVLARRLLDDPGFRAAARTLRTAQREAGGYERAADELERYLHTAGSNGEPSASVRHGEAE